MGRGRLVVWNPRIPRESQNSKVTTGPQTIWVTIAPTKQKHPEFRIRSPEVDFCLQNSTSGIFWHPWLWGGDELKMYGQLIILNEYVGGRNQVAGRKTLLENACMNLQVSLFLTPKNHQNFWNRSSTVLFCGGIFFAEGGGAERLSINLVLVEFWGYPRSFQPVISGHVSSPSQKGHYFTLFRRIARFFCCKWQQYSHFGGYTLPIDSTCYHMLPEPKSNYQVIQSDPFISIWRSLSP